LSSVALLVCLLFLLLLLVLIVVVGGCVVVVVVCLRAWWGLAMTAIEVMVLDTGDLPRGSMISFYDGSVPLSSPVEVAEGQTLSLTVRNTTDDIRVELMSQLGTNVVRVAQGQELYDVRIAEPSSEGAGDEVELKLQVRSAMVMPQSAVSSHSNGASSIPTPPSQVTPSPPRSRASGPTRPCSGTSGRASRMHSQEFSSLEQQRPRALDPGVSSVAASPPTHTCKPRSPNSPSGRLSRALNTGNYLSNHGVLTSMQELLGQLVALQPEAPLDFLIEKLEQASLSTKGVACPPEVHAVDLE